MSLADRAKNFLYLWNIIILCVGIVVMFLTGYIFLRGKEQFAVPSLSYTVAFVSGAILTIVSAIGIKGIRQHRKMISSGKRNCTLFSYVIVAFLASVLVILGAVIALTMTGVIDKAISQDYDDIRVEYLEQAAIENLNSYAVNNPQKWRNIQDAMLCCGYFDANEMDKHLSYKYVDKTKFINSVSGSSCTHEEANCPMGSAPCPRRNSQWCRDALLQAAKRNSNKIGSISLLLGLSQILAFVLSLYILLCDSRVDTNQFPIEIKV